MGEVFSYIETAVTRANETAQLNRECEGLMRENEELRQTVREQEAALHELQEQIRNLTIQLGREAEIDDPEIGMAKCQLPHLIQWVRWGLQKKEKDEVFFLFASPVDYP